MNTRWLCIVFAVVLAAGCLSAQGLNSTVKAEVPFAFVAGNTTLPAGEYKIVQFQPHALSVCVGNYIPKVMILTNATSSPDRNEKPRLVFNKYGEVYFLAEVWSADGNGRAVLKSRKEKDMAILAAHNASRVTLVAAAK